MSSKTDSVASLPEIIIDELELTRVLKMLVQHSLNEKLSVDALHELHTTIVKIIWDEIDNVNKNHLLQVFFFLVLTFFFEENCSNYKQKSKI